MIQPWANVITEFWQIKTKNQKGYILFNPYRPNPGRREKIELNFYFHTSLWCLKGLHKTFEAPERSVKIKI